MKRTRPGRPPLTEDDDSIPVCVTIPGRLYDALEKQAKADHMTVPERIRRDIRVGQKKYTK